MNRKLRNEELGRLDVDAFKKSEKSEIIVALNKIRSAHNVGSIFRTCDAFRISKLILGEYSPKPPQREVMKTALGATESVEWESVDDLLQRLRALKLDGYRIVSVEQAENSSLLQSFKWGEEALVLVLT